MNTIINYYKRQFRIWTIRWIIILPFFAVEHYFLVKAKKEGTAEAIERYEVARGARSWVTITYWALDIRRFYVWMKKH